MTMEETEAAIAFYEENVGRMTLVRRLRLLAIANGQKVSDRLHDDTIYWMPSKDSTMYFNVQGKQVSREQFERHQLILDHQEDRRNGHALRLPIAVGM